MNASFIKTKGEEAGFFETIKITSKPILPSAHFKIFE
jgi:hypothetical protein